MLFWFGVLIILLLAFIAFPRGMPALLGAGVVLYALSALGIFDSAAAIIATGFFLLGALWLFRAPKRTQ